MKVGSLFSGYGGLDIAVESFFHAETVWHAEWEDAPSKVLAHHWPGVPNFRDVSKVDWSTVEPVDIITGGFPCQDVSMAGKRAGMVEGTRSNLWGAMRTAIEEIRPQYAVIENVRGLLSATAQSDSDLEQYPGFMGDEPGVNLRALGRVLGDLADIGFNAELYGLRAADIGAPHGRYRIFILATNTEFLRGEAGRSTAPGQETSRRTPSEPVGCGSFQTPAYSESRGRRDALSDDQWKTSGEVNPPGNDIPTSSGTPGTPEVTATNTQGNGRDQGRTEPARIQGRPNLAVSSAPALTDSGSSTIGQHAGGSSAEEAGAASGDRFGGSHGEQSVTDWGPYGSAIRHWERVLGRPAPSPTEPSAKGKPQLSPAFVEWMMGLNPGHVTGIEGTSRAQQLNMLGNGVVPQQAYEALRRMKEAA